MNQDPPSDPASLDELSEEAILLHLLRWDHPNWPLLKRRQSFSGKWVTHFLDRDRPIPEDAIKEIFADKALKADYAIRLALFKNPHTPLALGLNLLQSIRWGDLLAVLRLPRVSPKIKQRIQEHFAEIMLGMTLGEKISLARRAPRFLIRILRVQGEPRVIAALMQNPYFTYEDALFLANYPRIQSDILLELSQSQKWIQYKEIRRSLVRNPRTPRNKVQSLLNGFNLYDMKILVQDRTLSTFTRNLAKRRLAELQKQRRGGKPGTAKR